MTKNLSQGDPLAALLGAAASELQRSLPKPGLIPNLDYAVMVQTVGTELPGVKKLQAALMADKSLGDLRTGWIQLATQGQRIMENQLCLTLLGLTGQGFQPAELLKQAREIARSRTANWTLYIALIGFSVRRPIRLASNIEVIPWGAVPDSRQKHKYDPTKNFEAIFAGPFPRIPLQPTAALRMEAKKRQILFPDQVEPSKDSQVEVGTMAHQASDIVRCITMLTTKPTGNLGSWHEFDSVLTDALVAKRSSSGDVFNTAFRDNDRIRPRELKDAFSKFGKFGKRPKAAMRIALDRLNSSLQKYSLVDRAIDLGIALEALLLHEIKDRGELTFRMSLRGASYLGGNSSARLNTYRALRDAYKLRSQAVHSGTIDFATGQQTLHRAGIICSKLALKVVHEGRFPDWDNVVFK